MHVTLPASKSIGARFLVCSYFAGTLAQTPRFDDCDDLRVIRDALMKLELNGEWTGPGSPPLDVHASGTAFRLTAAAAASTPFADFILTGTPRLCSRPMLPLLEVLREAGATIGSLGPEGTGPYRILGRRLKGGGFGIRGDVSSQFISALMLASPTWRTGMDLTFTTPLVSRPYAEMTARVMAGFGVQASLGQNGVTVKPGQYLAPRRYTVEADWSAAGFFYEAASMRVAETVLEGLLPPSQSMQGDAATAGIFARIGVNSIFENGQLILENEGWKPDSLDCKMEDTPDLVPALAVACAMNGIRFRFDGVKNLRLKESDRLEALRRELRKFGFVIETGEDMVSWDGTECTPAENPVVETYDDHRIAMSFAMAALKLGKISIANPDVVDKSFSAFWHCLPAVGLRADRTGGVMNVAEITDN